MQFDFAHAIVTGLILFAVMTLLKGRPIALQLGLVVVLVFILNIFWPY